MATVYQTAQEAPLEVCCFMAATSLSQSEPIAGGVCSLTKNGKHDREGHLSRN